MDRASVDYVSDFSMTMYQVAQGAAMWQVEANWESKAIEIQLQKTENLD